MARRDSVQEGGIILTPRWKLHPLDDRNWELCKRTESGAWSPYGRYYSHGSVGEALSFVADCEVKGGCADEAMTLTEALARWERVSMELRGTLFGDMMAAGDRG